MADKSINIYLWKLRREESAMPDEWSEVIVAAPTEKSAREQANQISKAEGYVWTDSTRVGARRLGTAEEGVYGIVMHTSEEQEGE